MSFSNALIILVIFSFFVCLTISMSIIYSIYYFIDLNHKLNKSRKQLVFREKYQRFKNTKFNISPEYDIDIQLSRHTIYIRR
jgi:predicted membrane protein